MNQSKKIWGLGFSQEAESLLVRLLQAGLVDAVATVDATPSPAEVLRQQWSQARGFVVVGACGLVTRLIAPLLQDKSQDPAVVVLDPEGRFAVPLLGGHSAGADRLSQQLAAALGGAAVPTGHSSGRGLLALDSFGQSWGWRRGAGDWSALMQRAARRQPLQLQQDTGLTLWQQCAAAEDLPLQPEATDSAAPPDLVISERLGPGCRWHPPRLWLGLGCERNTSLGLLDFLDGLPEGFDTPLTDEIAYQLPNGVRRLMALAQALIKDTPILLIDDISQGLAPDQFQAVLDALPSMRRCTFSGQDRSVIMATDNKMLLEKADRLCILDKGITSFQGTAEELRARMQKTTA